MEAGLQEGPQLRERGTGRPKWFDAAAGETDEGTALVGFLARNSESDATIHTDDASAYRGIQGVRHRAVKYTEGSKFSFTYVKEISYQLEAIGENQIQHPLLPNSLPAAG